MASLIQNHDAVKADRLARSWSRAFFRELFPDPSFQKQWETDVAGYLFERRYHHTIAARILTHAASHGSVDCSPDLAFDERDRRAVEKLLPLAPPSAWSRYDNERWATSMEG